MIASGSADKSVKFWSMTGETFIKSLSNFSHWVVKVTTMNLWKPERGALHLGHNRRGIVVSGTAIGAPKHLGHSHRGTQALGICSILVESSI